jgi:hypothetical protein
MILTRDASSLKTYSDLKAIQRTGHDALSLLEAQEAQQTSPAGVDWSPFPDSPQHNAYRCPADIIGYGGAAGGGKTDLGLGKAFTQFYKSIIFRREYPQLKDVITRGDEIQDGACSFVSGVKMRWDTPDGRQIELGALQHEKDVTKYKGRPHDLIVFDEAVDFTEFQVRFIMGWLRTDRPNVKPQVMLCFNPPTSPEGEWIIKFFAPWLDDDYADPAEPGELRWCVTVDSKDIWVNGPEPVAVNGQTYTPQSRTFFRALVEDNPVYMGTGYDRQRDSLPEPLRSQLRYGDFTVSVNDDVWQVIPTQWIIDAQNRTLQGQRPDVNLRAVGVDPSRGGDDETTIAKLYGVWFELVTYPGKAVPDGPAGARYVTDAMGSENAPVWIDVIGIGASVYDHLKVLTNMDVTPVNVGAGSDETDKTGRYGFANLRSQIMWQLREALDPSSGESIALPPGRELRADLRAARYSIVSGKIKVEPKDETKKRLGRSPDRGDVVAITWYGQRGGPTLTFAPAPDLFSARG